MAAARQMRQGRCAADPAWPLRGRSGRAAARRLHAPVEGLSILRRVSSLRVLAAVTAAGLLVGCGSSGGGSGAGDTSEPAIPAATARWSKADAVTIAHHIPGCASITRPTPRNDLERSMASLATCRLGDATVTIEDAPSDLAVSGTFAPATYVVAGYGWSATIDDKAAAEQVAAALGGRVDQ
jgi:hypothetical protein